MDKNMNLPTPQHVESSKNDVASTNPLTSQLNVLVSIPESIVIKMVDASTLGDYELWFFISSILSNAVIGYIVAYQQTPSQSGFIQNIMIFTLLFFISIGAALVKRRSLNEKSKTITLQAVQESPK